MNEKEKLFADQASDDGQGIEVKIEVDAISLDEAIEKADRLVEILREIQGIIGSLGASGKSEKKG